MKIVVTCGPSYEPIDEVRRITNFSTGRLGATLSNAFAKEGWTVICLRGEQATFPGPLAAAVQTRSFTTNQDLANQLRLLALGHVDAVFHAAALCDFAVAEVLDENGARIASPKFATRAGRLTLKLAPAPKILPELRGWFRTARIVGWKYELAGTREDAFAKAWQQIRDCGTDACVLNGRAYGTGFAVCQKDGTVREVPDGETLAQHLVDWLKDTSPRP